MLSIPTSSPWMCLLVPRKWVTAHLRAIEGWKKMYNFSLFLVSAKTTFRHIIILYHIKFPHNIQDKQIALGLGGIRQRFFCHDTCESAFEVFVFSGITTCIESIEILLNQFQEIILPWYLFFAFARQIFWEMDCFFSLSHYLLVSFLEGGAFEVPSGDFLPMISLPLKKREVWVPGMPSSLLISLKFARRLTY